MQSQHWQIDRYARYFAEGSPAPPNGGEWKQYDDAEVAMTLTVTDIHQLVIAQGSKALESHSLLSARVWMRGLCRNDSLLFVCKLQASDKSGTRKFRVRFSPSEGQSGEEQCQSCVQQLQKFFPVKMSNTQQPTLNSGTQDKEAKCVGEDKVPEKSATQEEVTLGEVAKSLLSSQSVAVTYQHHQVSPDVLHQMVRVCLADPAFPSFVQDVETALRKISRV